MVISKRTTDLRRSGGLSGIRGDLTQRARKVRQRIHQWIGIPICIGIASTKNLAKPANHVAKSAERKPGSYPSEYAKVCHWPGLTSPQHVAILQATDVDDIWGVGRRLSAQLHEVGIRTALDLAQADPVTIQHRWNLVLAKTVRELNGTACLSIEDIPPTNSTAPTVPSPCPHPPATARI